MFSVLLMVTSPVSGLGQDASDITPLLNALTVKGFDEKAAAVEALAQSGKDEAETLLEMLLEGRLPQRDQVKTGRIRRRWIRMPNI